MWWLFKRIKWEITTIAFTFLIPFSSSIAAPHEGEQFSLKQPDGTTVPVLVWGDEFHQDVESPDGYTLVRDKDGWICYASLSADENEYISSGIRYNPQGRAPSLKKKMRIRLESIHKKVRKNKEVLGYMKLIEPESEQSLLYSPSPLDEGVETAEPRRVTGLTILIDFPDVKSTTTRETIENFCNQQGYTGNGNNGSAYDYFRDVSNGQMLYTNVVTQFITADNAKSYYDRGEGYAYVQELLTNILNKLKNQGFDMSQVTTSNNRVVALNVFYAGSASAGWANGLWPHAGSYRGGVTINGIGFSNYQLASLGSSPKLGTFVHENGHMLMHWADLYSYEDHSNGVGRWCVMNTINPATNPQQPNPYFRKLSGWITTTDITGNARGTVYEHTANSHSAYTYVRNTKEFYLIEARRRDGRSSGLPADGLLVWHVHTDGRNTDPGKGFPLVALVQADGKRDMERLVNSGDAGDPFRLNYNIRFNDLTNPAAKWHDGTGAGIDLAEISAPGQVMTFKIGPDAEVVSYNLSVVNGSGSGRYSPGEVVTISAPETGPGGTFLRWSSSTLSPSQTYSCSTTLVMGNGDATITANYTTPGTIPGTIQAEQSGYQQGTSASTATDSGGGQYVNFSATGAFIEFVVDVQTEDTSVLSYRISSSSNAVLKVRNMNSNTLIDSVAVTGTGFSQSWRTVNGNRVALTPGRQIWRLESSSGSFNLNWFLSKELFTLTVQNGTGSDSYAEGTSVPVRADSESGSFLRWSSSSQAVDQPYSSLSSIRLDSTDITITAHFCTLLSLPGVIEAESAGYLQGITTDISSDEGGGGILQIGNPGTLAEYLVKAPVAGIYGLSFRLASTEGARLVLRNMKNDIILDTINVPPTGGPQNWLSVEGRQITLDTAIAVWRIESVSGACNFNRFTVSATGSLLVVNGSGSGVYTTGTVVPIQAATPAEHWKYFTGWTSDASTLLSISDPSQPVTTVTVGDIPIIVTATYADSPTVGIIMPGGTDNVVTVNDTFFYDNGGNYYGYSNNFSGEITFNPVSEGLGIIMSFELFSLSLPGNMAADSFYVYSGSGDNKVLLDIFNGAALPQQIRSSSPDGRITVRFVSNGADSSAGWKIHLTSENLLSISSPNRIPLTFGIEAGRNGTLNFQLPRTEHVNIRLYDMRGRMVAVLCDARKLPGFYKIGLSGSKGSKLSRGFYAATLVAGSYRKNVAVHYR